MLENPGKSFPLYMLYLITSVKFLYPSKGTHLQVSGLGDGNI
jgi:hypothetical protein